MSSANKTLFQRGTGAAGPIYSPPGAPRARSGGETPVGKAEIFFHRISHITKISIVYFVPVLYSLCNVALLRRYRSFGPRAAGYGRFLSACPETTRQRALRSSPKHHWNAAGSTVLSAPRHPPAAPDLPHFIPFSTGTGNFPTDPLPSQCCDGTKNAG